MVNLEGYMDRMEEVTNTADKIYKNKCKWQIILLKKTSPTNYNRGLLKASKPFLPYEFSKYKIIEYWLIG